MMYWYPIYQLHWYALFLGIIVLVGPALLPCYLLPPLTLANGCESIKDRIKWTALFTFIHYSHYLPDLLKGYGGLPLSSYNTMAPFMSGIWHFDRGDYRFRKLCYELATNERLRVEMFMRAKNINTTTNYIMLSIFRLRQGLV